jgi:2,4-dienoyl-CoA reductase-like NADH-dependent reductase (Old Yellow Enzyme family)
MHQKPTLATPLTFARGPVMSNRFMLAPITNLQSHVDGTLGEDEYRWLTMRAAGGFGLTMTCASHVERRGQGFPGQLGSFSDAHVPGLERLAAGIHAAGSLAAVQLHHAGMRAPSELIHGQPVGPFDDAATGTRGMTTAEVEQLIEHFIEGALRAERAGFDGVELHGAHGYVIGQFLDSANNRSDDYGGSFDNRCRLLLAIVDGIRARTRAGFLLGVRLSPERFGIRLEEACALAEQLMTSGQIDWLDMSLWDVFKLPEEAPDSGRPLISWFADLKRGETRLGVAGKILDAPTAQACLDHGADFVLLGMAAILHHDFPRRALADPGFRSAQRPVTHAHLEAEGVGPAFMGYLETRWTDFVAG